MRSATSAATAGSGILEEVPNVKHRSLAVVITASLLFNMVLFLQLRHHGLVTDARAETTAGVEDLSYYMAHGQHLVQKLGLSIESKNKPLADFYLKELGENFDLIQKRLPVYQGIQVATLSRAMMDPVTVPLSKALGASDWATATTAYSNYIDSCNNCHTAANRGFIVITVPKGNPFNQSFSPK